MKLKIEIQMDNAAFEDNQGPEACRILQRLIGAIQFKSDISMVTVRLRDVNGNDVGKAEVE